MARQSFGGALFASKGIKRLNIWKQISSNRVYAMLLQNVLGSWPRECGNQIQNTQNTQNTKYKSSSPSSSSWSWTTLVIFVLWWFGERFQFRLQIPMMWNVVVLLPIQGCRTPTTDAPMVGTSVILGIRCYICLCFLDVTASHSDRDSLQACFLEE